MRPTPRILGTLVALAACEPAVPDEDTDPVVEQPTACIAISPESVADAL